MVAAAVVVAVAAVRFDPTDIPTTTTPCCVVCTAQHSASYASIAADLEAAVEDLPVVVSPIPQPDLFNDADDFNDYLFDDVDYLFGFMTADLETAVDVFDDGLMNAMAADLEAAVEDIDYLFEAVDYLFDDMSMLMSPDTTTRFVR